MIVLIRQQIRIQDNHFNGSTGISEELTVVLINILTVVVLYKSFIENSKINLISAGPNVVTTRLGKSIFSRSK